MSTRSHALSQKQHDQLVNLLWDYMNKDPEHLDRVQTGWGTKTRQGLTSCIARIVLGGN